IPRISDVLLTERDDPSTDKAVMVHNAWEPNGVHFSGKIGQRKDKVVFEMACMIPADATRSQSDTFVRSKAAYYKPPGEGSNGGGGWLLTEATPSRLEPSELLEVLETGKYFLHTKEVDFERL